MQTLDGIITENLLYNATNRPSEMEKHKIVDFFVANLEEMEPNREFIRKSIDYATKERLSFGGFIIVNKSHGEIVGVSIVNQTGMEGYMTENVLAYFAVSTKFRNNGIAKNMVEQILRHAKGEVALHLKEKSTFAKIFKKIGFKKSIVEMRLERN